MSPSIWRLSAFTAKSERPLAGPNLAQIRGLGLRRSLYSTRFNTPELTLVSPRLDDRTIQSLDP